MRAVADRILLVLLASTLGAFIGCEQSSPQTSRTGPSDRAAAVPTLLDDSALRDPDQARVLGTVPRFRFLNQDKAGFGSKDLDGKVWIATFIFTRCQSTCPSARLKAITTKL